MARCCALAALLKLAAGQDGVALLQHSLAPQAEAEAMSVERLLREDGVKDILAQAGRLTDEANHAASPSGMEETIAAGKQFTAGFHKAANDAWKSFYRRSHGLVNPDPKALLHNGKLALLETGAFQEMRKLARTTANASSGVRVGAVPLDSMLVGFRTSAAPWNNILKMFKMPLIKASFTIFTNFFGPEGNAARLCIGASTAVDSEYGKLAKAEFSGINIFIGPAKWDNVPGWSFGTSGGYDNVKIMDVADFGWTWTLAKEPETVCFFYDLCIADDETLHSNMLQTGTQVQAEEAQVPEIKLADRHGSTWIQHIWCSPDWFNTPLVIPEDTTMMADKVSADGAEKPYFQSSEEWDPDSEAV